MSTELLSRIEKAAKILGKSPDDVKCFFIDKENIDDIDLLTTSIELTTYDEMMEGIKNDFGATFITNKIRTAMKIILGDKQSNKTEDKTSEISVLQKIIDSNRPIQQWSDKDVLDAYIDTEDDQYEYELNKRAKGRRFIILNDTEPETINVEASLNMLKRARKENPPSHYKSGTEIIYVYRIEDYHSRNRVRAESPFHPKVALFDDYCPVSNISFEGIDVRVRKVMRLILEHEVELTRRDKIDMVAIVRSIKSNVRNAESSVKEQISALIDMYPDIGSEYKKRKLLGTLPPLKMIESVSSVRDVKADPFNPTGGQ